MVEVEELEFVVAADELLLLMLFVDVSVCGVLTGLEFGVVVMADEFADEVLASAAMLEFALAVALLLLAVLVELESAVDKFVAFAL